jgi:hypothetical protein
MLCHRFAKSGKFSGVVAADFSETMLMQAKEYFQKDSGLKSWYVGDRASPCVCMLSPSILLAHIFRPISCQAASQQ